MGVVALAAGVIAAGQPDARRMLTVWIIAGMAAVVVGVVTMWLKASRSADPMVSTPARKFLLSFAPAVVAAGWDVQTQVREEVTFTAGRVHVRGKKVSRGKAKRADYVLYRRPNVPIAIIEAKDNNHTVGDGMQQALDYAGALDVPFVFSSNGDAFQFHGRTGDAEKIEQEITLDQLPSPDDLWRRYCQWKNLDDWKAEIVSQDY